MSQLLKYKNAFILLLLVAALLPYFIVCFYSLPFADDFCNGWTASENIGPVQKFLDQYLNWDGRFAADALMNLHPILTGNIMVCQIWLLFPLLATVIIIFILLKKIVRDGIMTSIVTLLIVLFYLCYQPNITEGNYWFIGVYNYFISNLLLILQVGILYSSFSAKSTLVRSLLQLLSIICLIASIGFNEVGAFLIPVYYFIALITHPLSYIKNRKIIAIHFGVAFIAAAFVFLSPGNAGREHEFPERFQLMHSLWYASMQTVRFIGTWFLSVPFITLSLLVLMYADKIQNPFIRRTDYRLTLAILLFTVYSGAFLPYFATGILGQHRTINYVFFYFIFLWLAFLISVSIKFSLRDKMVTFVNERWTFTLIIISIILMALTGNSYRILNDFTTGSFTKYDAEFIERQNTILANNGAPITPLKNIPSTFRVVDVKSDTSWWVDKCMKNFYTHTGIILK